LPPTWALEAPTRTISPKRKNLERIIAPPDLRIGENYGEYFRRSGVKFRDVFITFSDPKSVDNWGASSAFANQAVEAKPRVIRRNALLASSADEAAQKTSFAAIWMMRASLAPETDPKGNCRFPLG